MALRLVALGPRPSRLLLVIVVAAFFSGRLGLFLLAYALYRLVKYREGRPGRSISSLPRRTSPDPLRGAKLAFLVVVGDRVLFHPVVRGEPYGPDAAASCARGKEHRALPASGCSCGFYAWNASVRRVTRWWVWRCSFVKCSFVKADRGMVRRAVRCVGVLDVEMMGRVVVYKHGYRAGRQRVLSASVDQRCTLCPRPAVGFSGGMFLATPGTPVLLNPTCGCQMPVRWSIQDVANMAGTEVRWDPHRKPPLTKRCRRA